VVPEISLKPVAPALEKALGYPVHFHFMDWQAAPHIHAKASITGTEKIRIAVEAGVKTGWEKFIGSEGHFIGMHGFGASAPAEVLYEKFGITAKKAAGK
jgi:transketolase